MPKVVVDLSKFEENSNKVVKALEAYEQILKENKKTLVSHDIKVEIENFKNFKKDLLKLVIERNDKDFLEKYPEECEDIPPDDIDDAELANQVEQERKKGKFVTDKFGNVLLKPPENYYTHVELSYYVYSNFVEVRFLGNIFAVPARFYVEKLEHKISPTTLKILENIDDFLIGNALEELIKTITEYIKRLDEACLNPNKKPQTPPPITNWKEWGEKYFYPPPVFEEISELKEFFDKLLVKIGEESSPAAAPIKEALQEAHQEGSLDTNKKEDTTPSQSEPSPEEICFVNPQKKELSQQALDLANKRWKEFQRKHSLECLLRELRDCLIPNDFQFCDFFKDLDLNNFYKKLSLLKTAGMNETYDRIVKKIEDDLGATQLREISRDITSLEKLVSEEEELLQYLTQRLEEGDKRAQNILLELVKVEARIKRIQQQLQSTVLTQSERTAYENKLQKEEARKTNLKISLNRENLEKQSLPDRKRTLSSNLERNRQQLESLKEQFSSAVQESQFDEKQAELIAGGKNLEAALLVLDSNGKVSEEAYKNAIINSIDSIIPFENLCQLLFQVSFSVPNITLPDNLDEVLSSFTSNFKDPFAGFFDKISLAILDFVLTSLMQIIDSLLNSLCSLADGVVANALASSSGVTGQPEWDNFGQQVLNQVQSTGLQILNAPTASKVNKFGVSTPNTRLTANLVNTEQVSGSTVISPEVKLEGEGLIDLLTSTVIPQPSPLSQWRLSQDRKSFTTVPLPELFDFSQLDKFLTTQINEMIKNSNRWSANAIAESFGNSSVGQESPTPILEDRQSVILSSLQPQQSVEELKCLINTSISLMSPSQSILLLTKKADRQTKEMLSSLARVCAPNLTAAYPGLDFIANLIGEVGIAAGSRQFERRIDNLIESDQMSPISEEVVCQRFDSTSSFIKSLMSRSIPETLANEIFNEIQIKRLEQFNNIINSLTDIGDGSVPSRQSKTATDFYLEAIDKMIENNLVSSDGSKREINVSLDDLGVQKQAITQQTSLSSVVEDEARRLSEENSTLNAMFDLISISIFNPIKNSFNRDISSFINTISSTKEVEKEVKIKEIVKDPKTGNEIEIPSLEMQLLIEGKLVPAIKITLVNNRPFDNRIILDELQSPDWSFESVVVPRDSLSSSLIKASRTIYSNFSISDINFSYINSQEQTIFITYDGVSPTDENPLYITNGFVEENFSRPFIDKPAKQKITRNEVGNKIIESLKEIKNTAIITPNSISISQKHGALNDNPFSLMPNLFNINQQQLDNINVNNVLGATSVDPECLQDLSLSIANGGSIDNITSIIPQNISASDKIKVAIPTWSLEEIIDTNSIKTDLRTSGYIFTPYGNYYDFSHNTNISGQNKLSSLIKRLNSGKLGDNVDLFRKFFFNKIERDLGYQNLENNVNIVNRMRDLLTELRRSLFIRTVDQILNNRLLKEFEPEKTNSVDIGEKSNTRIKLKLIEYLNLTRQPTEFEKENNIDPNIMDFEKLKQLFKDIEQKETEEIMNISQIRGDEDHESKTIKASKHILALSFLKTCAVDYVLKGIFVYDSMNYREDIVYSDFICNDIGNHVLKEAERYGLNEDIHRQLTKYYDFLIQNNMLQETQQIADEMKVWKENSYYSSINCNPKMKKIVEVELRKIVNKLKKLTSCSQTENGENTLSKNAIQDLEEYNVAQFLPGGGEVSLPRMLGSVNLQNFREKGSLFLERYVKIGNFNKEVQDIQIGSPGQNLVNSSFLSNSVVTFEEFINIKESLLQKGYTSTEIFDCDTNSETLFDEPPKFGLRVVLVADLNNQYNRFFNLTFNQQQQGHFKTRSYMNPVNVGDVTRVENNLVIAEEESPISEIVDNTQQLLNLYNNLYSNLLRKRLYTNEMLAFFLNYFVSMETIWKLLATNSFLVHSDQQGKFLFESTKTAIVKMFNSVKNNGDSKKIVSSIEEMFRQQKEREDNVGNPLGPSLEALKFFYRTPIQIMKGLSTITDPNLGIADKIVAGASMASSLTGQNIDIPYSVASLALLPGPLPFSGIPPIPPPLTFYNFLFPVGPTFLLLEHLLKDLPYYQNQNQGGNNRGQVDLEDSNNPFSCELLPEENETE